MRMCRYTSSRDQQLRMGVLLAKLSVTQFLMKFAWFTRASHWPLPVHTFTDHFPKHQLNVLPSMSTAPNWSSHYNPVFSATVPPTSSSWAHDFNIKPTWWTWQIIMLFAVYLSPSFVSHFALVLGTSPGKQSYIQGSLPRNYSIRNHKGPWNLRNHIDFTIGLST
jgi:hypothetical protein